MSKYRLIIEYFQKGNNQTQIATLCGCSRMTVWRILKRLDELEIETTELIQLSDGELTLMFFRNAPNKAKAI